MKTLLTLAALAALTLCSLEAQQNTATAKAEPTATPITAPSKPVQVDVKTTLGELVEARASLDKLFSVDLPAQAWFDLRKTVLAVREEQKGYDEKLVALRKRYVTVIDGRMNLPPENVEAWNAEYKALGEVKVQLKITLFPLSALGDIKLSANDMARLEPFLVP